MSKMTLNKIFFVGFMFGLLLFLMINYFSYLSFPKPYISHALHKFGFPFAVYADGGFEYTEQILWFGLIADILTALSFSFILGFVFRHIWSKITARQFK